MAAGPAQPAGPTASGDRELDAGSVGPYLVSRGVFGATGEQIVGWVIEGGVSNVTLGARQGDRRVVVKQSLGRLRVPDVWLAERDRILTEGGALRWLGEVTPGALPPVVDLDPERCVLILAHAPAGWEDWRNRLLAGRVDPSVATRLGKLLASWHAASASWAAPPPWVGSARAFDQLRVDPYYRTVMARRPEVAPFIGRYMDQMLARHACLVDGDFSPKNVLVGEGDGGLWIIDLEVAHLGDPAFDLAFMLHHLVLKALHRPQDCASYMACALAFWEAYAKGAAPGLLDEASYVLGHVACLVLARVDGKSPAAYLTEPERVAARALGDRLLASPPSSIDALADLVAAGAPR